MVRMLIIFIAFWILIASSFELFRALTGKERWQLIKTLIVSGFYAIITLVVLGFIVILF